MNNSTMNFITPEAPSNPTTRLFELIKICGFGIHFLFGLPLNHYVIWLIISGRKSGAASEFFNLNLSVCEIINSLNAIFGLLSSFFSSFTMVTYFLQGLGITGRPLFQCLMCVERYLAVVHPVTFLKYKPLRYRVICCSVVWIIIVGSCFFCVLILVSVNMVAYVWFFLTQFLLFISIQLFCLVTVLRALKRSGPGEREKKEDNHMKRRVFYLILFTTLNMIVQYFPFTIIGFFVIVTQWDFLQIWSPAFLCYVLTGFVPPVLYLQRVGKLSCFCSS